jgi:hypothetical protein
MREIEPFRIVPGSHTFRLERLAKPALSQLS